MDPAIPTHVRLRRKSATLELRYADGDAFALGAEFLRVHSPSAEVRGHGRGQETLQSGKRRVAITAVEPVGRYAVRLTFDDGHDTGIYSWEYLRELGGNEKTLWRKYLERLAAAGATRDPLPPDTQVIKVRPAPSG